MKGEPNNTIAKSILNTTINYYRRKVPKFSLNLLTLILHTFIRTDLRKCGWDTGVVTAVHVSTSGTVDGVGASWDRTPSRRVGLVATVAALLRRLRGNRLEMLGLR